MFGSKLEEEFVVVTWDQRGSGKSYSAIDPTENLTLDQLLDDTLEVTNYLRDRFDREKIYLVGNSWGTTLGTLAVYEKPELYTAYIGTGQMVSQKETDIMFYEDTLKYARDNDNSALEDDLIANRKPPYQDIYKYEIALSHEREWNEFPHFTGESEMSSTLTASEYTLVDTINGFGAFLDSFSVLYPQLQDIDFRKDIVKLEVPVYMVVGKYEARGRAVLADEWFENLEAPSKKRVVFEESAHRPHFEQPEEFIELMIEVKQVTKK
jgi:pimeloyl-ACP methyl ester carboxylesterase